ncbi:MAG: hypothetical protein JO144_01240 [Actinobacteria bacterium]|nr:hypothetical protein [Actinomycetota bacterium]
MNSDPAGGATETGGDKRLQPLVGQPTTVDAIKQLDYAKDAILQVITLSSAIVAVSLTFAQNWASGTSRSNKFLLQLSWIAFLLAILCGIWSILALTGLAYLRKPNVRAASLRVPWLAELLFFFAGLGLLTIFGFRVL